MLSSIYILLCVLHLNPTAGDTVYDINVDTLSIGFYSKFSYDVVDVYVNGVYVSTNTLYSGNRGLADIVKVPLLHQEKFEVQILFYEKRSIHIEYNPLWYPVNKLNVEQFMPPKLFTYKGRLEDGKYISCDLVDAVYRTRSLLNQETELNLEFNQTAEKPIID